MTMNKEEFKKYVEEHMSYLCLYDMEGNVIDAFLNLKMRNNYYVEQQENIINSGAENVVMTFTDLADGCISGALYPHMVDKVNLVLYTPDKFVQLHPEWFLEDDE